MWYDIFVLAVLGYTTIRGAMKGVIWQLAAIAGLVACLVFAESISAAVGPYVKLEPPLNNWVVMFGAYLVFSFLSFGIARMITEWLEKIHFGEYNRHLGAIFGFVKGVVVCLVLTFFIVTVSEDARDMLQNSRSGKAAAIIMDRLHPVMPEKLHEALGDYIHRLDSPDLPLKYGQDAHTHSHDGEAGAGHGALGQSAISLPKEFDELLSKVPADVRGDFRDVLLRSLEKSQPETRAQLLDRLLRALDQINGRSDVSSLQNVLQQPPDRLLAAVTDWLRPSPAAPGGGSTATFVPPAPAPAPAPPGAGTTVAGTSSRRQVLLQEISSVFSSYAKAQAMIQQDIEKQLAGVPDGVALPVLEDWRADLWGVAADPDPATNIATTLQDRIVRQTAAAAGPEGQLQ